MMAVGRLCVLAILCTLSALLLRRLREEYAIALRVAAAVLLGTALIPAVMTVVRYVEELSELLPSAGLYVGTLLKALGVAFLAQMCAGVCRDCGEAGIASWVEWVGKAQILLLSLPLMSEILGVVERALSW